MVVLLQTYKSREDLERYVMGVDVNMERVDLMMRRYLVGRVEFAKVNRIQLINWVNKQWVLVVGYAPWVNLMINGSIIFIFMNEEKIDWIIKGLWFY